MKSCMNCGAQIDETDKFCPHCGTSCDNGKETEGSAYQMSDDYQGNVSETRTNQYSMKWHKFLMVAMILGGILTIANGIRALAGSEYIRSGLDSSRVYNAFPGLKSADMFYGVVLIALGVFEFVVRSRLNKFQVNGPGSLKILYILSIAASVIYMAWASSATKLNMFTTSNVASLGASVVLLIINSVYYSKRSSLFVN